MAISLIQYGFNGCENSNQIKMYCDQIKIDPNQAYILLEKIYGGSLGWKFDPRLQISYLDTSTGKLAKEAVRISQFPDFFSNLYGRDKGIKVTRIRTSDVPLHDIGEVRVGEYSRMPFIDADLTSGRMEIRGPNLHIVNDTRKLIKAQWYYAL